MATTADRRDSLAPVEWALVECVERGEVLDLVGSDPVDEAAMRAWDDTHTISAAVVRDIVRGRLAGDPDPQGLRLRGARIHGRLDLENITSNVVIELKDCFLVQGANARDAKLPRLALPGCRLDHPSEPLLDASRLTAALLILKRTTGDAHCANGGVVLEGAHLGCLNCDGARLSNDSGPVLHAEHLHVDQNVYLQNGFEAIGSSPHGTVRLTNAHLGGLECDYGVRLSNDSGPALHAQGLWVDQNVFLRHGFVATGAGKAGAVRLKGAHLRRLECDGARLFNDSGPALHAEDLDVDQAVFLRNGFVATGAGEKGAVRLLGARLGHLDCSGARLSNGSGPALHAEHLHVDQNVYLRNGFEAIGAGEKGAVLDLTDAVTEGVLHFSPTRLEHRTNSHAQLRLDGLIYTGLPVGISTADWCALLRHGTPKYAAQPYRQLAAAQQAAGHEREARRVLIAQRRDQIGRHALTGRSERAWARLTGLLLGYGYQPWRALLGLAAVITTAVVLAVVLGGHGALNQVRTSPTLAPTQCTTIERISVGLDLGTPLVTTGTRPRCEATNTSTGQLLTTIGWALRLFAWAFATLFIAGFTSAVRKT